MTARTTDQLTELARIVAQTAGTVDLVTKKQQKALDDLLERLETLEAGRSMPGATSPVQSKAADREHMQQFSAWLRKPFDTQRQHALAEFESKALEAKDITIGVPASGGFAVPEEISRQIERLEMALSPVRSIVKVVTAGTSDYKELVGIRGAASGWVGESDVRSGTATPQLRERAPTHGEVYAYPQVSEWSLDDMFFNVGSWIADEVADSFAAMEQDAVLTCLSP